MDNAGRSAIFFNHNQIFVSNRSIFCEQTLFNTTSARKVAIDSKILFDLIDVEVLFENSDEIGQWLTVREALKVIDAQEFPLLVRSVSLLQWNKYHQFCGACATKTILTSRPFERFCSSCEMSFYPRISPAIIVLIYKKNEILMARSPHFPPGVYALIAGFVEAGETIENAVHREVLEEVGIKIKNLSYFGSQPWPFPDSLMIGFIAEYESGEILLDQNELEDAGWYPYNELPGLPSFPISIGYQLIQHFIAGQIVTTELKGVGG